MEYPARGPQTHFSPPLEIEIPGCPCNQFRRVGDVPEQAPPCEIHGHPLARGTAWEIIPACPVCGTFASVAQLKASPDLASCYAPSCPVGAWFPPLPGVLELLALTRPPGGA